MTPFSLRAALPRDADFLTDMLCEAVNWDPGREPLSRAQILADPTMARYVEGWPRPGDTGVIAESGRPFAAVWLRHFTAEEPGYGFISPEIPELTIAVLPGWRGHRFGERLLMTIFEQAIGFDRVSLSVERANRARDLYLRFGFTTVESGADSDTMVKILTTSTIE